MIALPSTFAGLRSNATFAASCAGLPAFRLMEKASEQAVKAVVVRILSFAQMIAPLRMIRRPAVAVGKLVSRYLCEGGRFELAADRGLSQERLANESDLERRYVGGIERGEENPPSLEQLAAGLGVHISAFFVEPEKGSKIPSGLRLGAQTSKVMKPAHKGKAVAQDPRVEMDTGAQAATRLEPPHFGNAAFTARKWLLHGCCKQSPAADDFKK
jgi:transcriptional regulator with XRE-family HTH domain